MFSAIVTTWSLEPPSHESLTSTDSVDLRELAKGTGTAAFFPRSAESEQGLGFIGILKPRNLT